MKVKAYVHAQYDDFAKEFRYSVFAFKDAASIGYTLIEEIEIEFTPPPREVMVNGTIGTYREKQKDIRVQAERQCQELQRHIDDLLCIEYKPEPALPKCPKCGAEDAMEPRRHRFSTEGGSNLPDADWTECSVCGHTTDPE